MATETSTNFSHVDFVYALSTSAIKIKVKSRRKEFIRQFITPGLQLLMIALLILIILPFVTIPVISYLVPKWSLLFGYIGVWFGVIITNVTLQSSKPFIHWIEFTLCLMLLASVLVFYNGVFNLFSFSTICLLYTYSLMTFSDILHDKIVTQQLIHNPEFYQEVIENGYIEIIHLT